MEYNENNEYMRVVLIERRNPGYMQRVILSFQYVMYRRIDLKIYMCFAFSLFYEAFTLHSFGLALWHISLNENRKKREK